MRKGNRLRGQIALSMALTLAALTGCTGSDGASRPPTPSTPPTATASTSIDLSASLQRLEKDYSARIGVSAVDTGTGETISYRADERFGYASTLKVFVAAGFLSGVPAKERETTRRHAPTSQPLRSQRDGRHRCRSSSSGSKAAPIRRPRLSPRCSTCTTSSRHRRTERQDAPSPTDSRGSCRASTERTVTSVRATSSPTMATSAAMYA